MCPDLVVPLNMLAGGVLLLVVIGIIAGIGLWYAYDEVLALVELLSRGPGQPDDAPALTSPQLVWSAPAEEPEPVERMGSSVNWPPEPLWPDVFRQRARDEEAEEED